VDRGNPTRSHCRAILIWACEGSINARVASGEKTSFFFHPVQLDLALPHVLVSLRLKCLVVLRALGASCRENVGHLLVELMLPVRDLGGMHPLCPGELVDRFEPFDRVEGDPSFARSTRTFPLCRHLLLPPPSHLDTAFYLNHLSSFRGTLYSDLELLPALERYDGIFFRILRKARREGTWPDNLDVLIISAKYGLLELDTAIEKYDLRMTKMRAKQLKPVVAPLLTKRVTDRDCSI
jgi:hypothetical protein